MNDEICIIGMAGVYPQCKDTDELWEALLNQKDLSRQDDSQTTLDNFVPSYYNVEDVEYFDNELFGYTPHECVVMDPQHRILLECTFRALENAGYINGEGNNVIGIFMSGSMSSYMLNNILKNSQFNTEDINYTVLTGNDKDFLATRMAYKLNFSGPSFTVQSACSSSLVSLSTAINSIRAGECNTALVGGVSLQFPEKRGYAYKEGGIFSKTGVCCPFDEKADGTVKGNGCSVIVIKKLNDAVRDNDHILAVIKGVAVNNDGNRKIGFTAPSIEGQRKVIEQAVKNAHLTDDAVDYIEAHGTGTPLGDPIEIRAISEAYKNRTSKEKIYMGSIKANVGHLDAAAGITSIIKSIYILNNGKIPAIKNLEKLNPALYNYSEKMEFPTKNVEKNVQYAGVSAFGIGGTNVHVILSKYKHPESKVYKLESYAVPFSYLRDEDVSKCKEELYNLIQSRYELEDIVYSICMSQKRFANCHCVVCKSKEELIDRLKHNVFIDDTEGKQLRLPTFSLEEYQQIEKNVISFFIRCKEAKEILKKDFLEQEDYDKVLSDFIIDMGITSSRRCKIIKSDPDMYLQEKKINPIEKLMHFIASANVYFMVDWKMLYGFQGFQLIKAFHYPMNKKKFWIKPDEEEKGQAFQSKEDLSSITIQDIIKIWSEELGVETVSEDDDFFALGGDSMIAIDIIDELEKKFFIKIAMKDFMNYCTPQGIYKLAIRKNISQGCISKIKEGKQKYNLFLVHAAGGGTFEYKEMARLLKSDFTVYAIDLPDDYKKYNSIEKLSTKYLEEIKKIQGKGKYYFGGHSLGGNIAYEMSLQVQKEGQKAELILFDSYIPQAYTNCIEEEINFEKIFNMVKDNYADNNQKILEKKLNGQNIKQFYDKWVHNYLLLKNYNATSKIKGNIILYQAEVKEDPKILEGLHIDAGNKMKWEEFCTGEFKKYFVSGNHYSMFSNQHNREDICKKFDRYLLQMENEEESSI